MTAHQPGNAPKRPHLDPLRRRGRPVGSVSLTAEIEATIVSYIRGGAFDYVAAEAAGISERTFRDWMARGEARSDRACTPKLRAFARAVRRARAEARLGAEVRVYRERPAWWLTRAARTTPEREGWTEPTTGAPDAGSIPKAISRLTDEELDEEIARLEAADLESGRRIIPPCSHRRCRCPWHKPRPPRG